MNAVKVADDGHVTAAQVVAAFKAAGGRGRLPDEGMVEVLAEYINDKAWFDRAVLLQRRGFARRDSPLMTPFWQALTAIERTSAQVLASQRFIRGLDMDASEIDARIKRIEEMISLAKELRTSMFPSHYGKRHERWHDVAIEIAPLIDGAFRAAGRKITDFQTQTSSGVIMVQWALERFGHQVEPEAIVKMFQRAKSRTTPDP
jgi:sugar phosphate isomerase/epimerase